MTFWANGSVQQGDEVAVAVCDPGLLLGQGVFETMLAVDGEVRNFDRHWARLERSAEIVGLGEVAFSFEEVMKGIGELLEGNGLKKGRARVRLTRTPGLFLVTGGVAPVGKAEIAVATVGVRVNETSGVAGAKVTSYASNLAAQREAEEKGADLGLMLNSRGEVCETNFANVFFEIGGKVVTPALETGCLPGITRELVLERCEVEEVMMGVEGLEKVEAMWVTSSLRGVQRVGWLNGKRLSRGSGLG